MTLENLLRIGKLRAHAARRVEIDRLLDAAARALRDADNESLSADGRFLMAYKAIMEAAMAAILASGAQVRHVVEGDYVILYMVRDGVVHLLSIKHHRQLSFDFGGHWP